jgi:hypothetical protein
MNEHRKEYEKHVFDREASKQEQTAEELACEIKAFFSENKNLLKYADKTLIYRLLNQINCGQRLTPKVIRAMKRKFESVQRQYE